jgi:hypothetical protein
MVRKYCPIKMDDDTDESYAARLNWIKNDSVNEATASLQRCKEAETQ